MREDTTTYRTYFHHNYFRRYQSPPLIKTASVGEMVKVLIDWEHLSHTLFGNAQILTTVNVIKLRITSRYIFARLNDQLYDSHR